MFFNNINHITVTLSLTYFHTSVQNKSMIQNLTSWPKLVSFVVDIESLKRSREFVLSK